MFGDQASFGIPRYTMSVKYDLNVYTEKSALPDEQQTLMDISVEAVDGDIVLEFKKFLVEEGEITLLSMVPITSSMHLMTLLVREMAQIGAKLLLILAQVEAPNFLIPVKASGYLITSWQARHGCF